MTARGVRGGHSLCVAAAKTVELESTAWGQSTKLSTTIHFYRSAFEVGLRCRRAAKLKAAACCDVSS